LQSGASVRETTAHDLPFVLASSTSSAPWRSRGGRHRGRRARRAETSPGPHLARALETSGASAREMLTVVASGIWLGVTVWGHQAGCSARSRDRRDGASAAASRPGASVIARALRHAEQSGPYRSSRRGSSSRSGFFPLDRGHSLAALKPPALRPSSSGLRDPAGLLPQPARPPGETRRDGRRESAAGRRPLETPGRAPEWRVRLTPLCQKVSRPPRRSLSPNRAASLTGVRRWSGFLRSAPPRSPASGQGLEPLQLAARLRPRPPRR
jgi:hypothetical protein